MMQRPAIGAEGSAGPEGGRKAPAHGGRSGAARRCRRANKQGGLYLRLALSAAISSFVSTAHADTPMDDVIELCTHPLASLSVAVEHFSAKGWRLAQIDDVAHIAELSADRVVLSRVETGKYNNLSASELHQEALAYRSKSVHSEEKSFKRIVDQPRDKARSVVLVGPSDSVAVIDLLGRLTICRAYSSEAKSFPAFLSDVEAQEMKYRTKKSFHQTGEVYLQVWADVPKSQAVEIDLGFLPSHSISVEVRRKQSK